MPRRPTAFEVSFPSEEPPAGQSTSFAERAREEARASAASAQTSHAPRLKRTQRSGVDRQGEDRVRSTCSYTPPESV